MDLKTLLSAFSLILIAELGDKTQLATMAFAAQSKSPLAVFIGAGSALLLTSLLAVVAGSLASRYIPTDYVRIGAGVLFIVVGVLLLWR